MIVFSVQGDGSTSLVSEDKPFPSLGEAWNARVVVSRSGDDGATLFAAAVVGTSVEICTKALNPDSANWEMVDVPIEIPEFGCKVQDISPDAQVVISDDECYIAVFNGWTGETTGELFFTTCLDENGGVMCRVFNAPGISPLIITSGFKTKSLWVDGCFSGEWRTRAYTKFFANHDDDDLEGRWVMRGLATGPAGIAVAYCYGSSVEEPPDVDGDDDEDAKESTLEALCHGGILFLEYTADRQRALREKSIEDYRGFPGYTLGISREGRATVSHSCGASQDQACFDSSIGKPRQGRITCHECKAETVKDSRPSKPYPDSDNRPLYELPGQNLENSD